MALKNKDFIEIKFTGKIKDGEIFDSNIKEDLSMTDLKLESKPFVFCLGSGMFLKGVDDFLIGKDVGEYDIELPPEKAFGKRDSTLVQMLPLKVFIQHKLSPSRGDVFNFDGRVAKVLSVSGGRVMVDFNNPLAGKTVVYKIRIIKKIENLDDKIKALNEFLFKRDFDFEVKNKKIILKVEKGMAKIAELFRDKFKEILGLELEVKEIKEKKMVEGKKKAKESDRQAKDKS